jgi:hypothetical protein
VKKTCRICKIEKPILEFYRHKLHNDGYRYKCIVCCKLDEARRREQTKKDWDKTLEQEIEINKVTGTHNVVRCSGGNCPIKGACLRAIMTAEQGTPDQVEPLFFDRPPMFWERSIEYDPEVIFNCLIFKSINDDNVMDNLEHMVEELIPMDFIYAKRSQMAHILKIGVLK